MRRAQINLEINGDDGFTLTGSSSMSLISRDPLELVRQSADNDDAELERALFGSYVQTVYEANIRNVQPKRASIDPALRRR